MRVIVRFCRWVLDLCGEPVEPPPPPLVDPLILASAITAVTIAQDAPHTGSYKAVIALKRLVADHPTTRRRDLRLAIELAVRQTFP